jgi:iron complex outermembrane recepter protein
MGKAVWLMAAAWTPAVWAQQVPPTNTPAAPAAPAGTPAPRPVPELPAPVADPVLVSPTAADAAPTAATQADAGQTAAEPAGGTGADASGADEPDIIVTGSRNLPGSVVGDIPPEVQLGPADIRAYGVNSVAELLTELAPQTGSGRGSGGQPVILLNGRRISGFQEIRDLPTEAIARVDILPEEVALKYGYRADQRVVNFVLRRRFRAATVEATDAFATDGGQNRAQGELDLLNLIRDTRANLHLSYTGQTPLTEAERGIVAPASNFSVPGNVDVAGTMLDVPAGAATGAVGLDSFLGTGPTATDPTPYRTLLSSQSNFGASGTFAKSIFGNIGASVNGRLDATSSTGQLGLPTVSLALAEGNPFSPFAGPVTVQRALLDGFNPLQQRNSAITTRLGTTLNGGLGSWNWSLTGAWDRVRSDTTTDIGLDATAFQARLMANDPGANPFGRLTPADIGTAAANRAQSTSNNVQADALLFGRLFRLPAGDVSTSLRAGVETSRLDSESFRQGLVTTGAVRRDTANGQANIDLPIASARAGVLPWLGQLSLNGNFAVDELSDFGTLTTIGYGINWAPVTGVRLIASATDQDQAPSASQLANPIVTTPNVRVFDYVAGTTAIVTTVTGGNPTLVANNRHSTKVGLTLKPWSATDLTLTADYTTQRIDDPIAGFPTPTAIIEAVFPDRFTRDAAGQLLRIDTRPINFARSERSQLRWGFNFSQPIRSALQKRVEAFRAGTGPNPFAGLRPPGGARPGGEGQAAGGQPPQAGSEQAPAGAAPAGERGGRGQGGRGGFGGRGAGGGGFGGGGFGGGQGQGGGRIQFALYHTWRFTDRVTIADGGPELDLLNGDATGQRGGEARHQLELNTGYSNNGLGVRLSGEFRSATTVNGGTPAAPTTLEFGSLTTLDLRLFADLGQQLGLVRRYPWVRGARVTLAVDNLFNQRQQVTDAAGQTPIGFQPGYLDPLGRTVRVSLRKLFF